jgi:hypothetical protein
VTSRYSIFLPFSGKLRLCPELKHIASTSCTGLAVDACNTDNANSRLFCSAFCKLSRCFYKNGACFGQNAGRNAQKSRILSLKQKRAA